MARLRVWSWALCGSLWLAEPAWANPGAGAPAPVATPPVTTATSLSPEVSPAIRAMADILTEYNTTPPALAPAVARGAMPAAQLKAMAKQDIERERGLSRKMLSVSAQLLGLMTADATAVYGVTVAGIASLGFQDVTSPWKDPDLRNGFDTVESITSVIGPAALAASVLFLANDKGTEAKIAGGVGGIGISVGLLGKLFFGNTQEDAGKKQTRAAQRASEAMQQIEISRRAFDEVQLQIALLNRTREKARERIGRLKDLQNQALELSLGVERDEPNQKEVIEYVDAVLAEFGTTSALAGFVNEYLDGLLVVSRTYQAAYPGKLQNLNFTKFDAEITALKAQFEETIIARYVRPMPTTSQLLQSWRQQAATASQYVAAIK